MLLEKADAPGYASFMRLSTKIMTREIGTALAVLAIYVLTLLLPLHQAAAQQRDLDALGYSTLSSWSVCARLAEDAGERGDAAALSCPAVGIGKHQLAILSPVTLPFAPMLAQEPLRFARFAFHASPTSPDHVGQSRAPPVPV